MPIPSLNSSIDGVADSSRLYLPCAKASRRNSCASIENKGFSHLCQRNPGRLWRKAERSYRCGDGIRPGCSSLSHTKGNVMSRQCSFDCRLQNNCAILSAHQGTSAQQFGFQTPFSEAESDSTLASRVLVSCPSWEHQSQSQVH